MTEPTPVLVPAEFVASAREIGHPDIALHSYQLLPNDGVSRLLRRARMRSTTQHFEHRWRFASSAPLSEIRSLWLSSQAQFNADEARELLKKLPSLETVYWQRTALDSLPTEEFLARGIRITTSHGLSTRWVSEAILACILSDAKLLSHSARDRMPPLSHFTRALATLHIAIVGTGAIGSDTASLCRALGMRVTGLARQIEDSANRSPAFTEIRSSGDDLIRTAEEADYLVLALPLTSNSAGIVGEEVLNALGPRGVLVNLARPGLVNQRAMLGALNKGKLGAAYVSRLEGATTWTALQSRWTHNLVLTHNREAHVREKSALALKQFFALLDSERLRIPSPA